MSRSRTCIHLITFGFFTGTYQGTYYCTRRDGGRSLFINMIYITIRERFTFQQNMSIKLLYSGYLGWAVALGDDSITIVRCLIVLLHKAVSHSC